MVEYLYMRRAAALIVALHFPQICGEKPDGANARVLHKDNNALNCRPCSKIGHDNCPQGHFKCMNELSFDFEISELRRRKIV